MNTILEYIKALADYAWPIVFFVVVFVFKTPIVSILTSIKRQVDQGASVKYRDLELVGKSISEFPSNVSSQEPLAVSSIYERLPADKALFDDRHGVYEKQKNIFLVHRSVKTDKLHEDTNLPVFDISIYLIIHKTYGRLNDINYVEYYLGRYFDRKISDYGAKYIVRNSLNGFAIRTTAYGPTLCEARVFFHGGESVILHRYLDFEGLGYRFSKSAANYDEGRPK